MSLIIISNPYVNHPIHTGDIPNLEADVSGRLRNSFT
jgi:Cu/Zn superoxide dismutase